MATKQSIATLVLRILALVFIAGSVAIFVTNEFILNEDEGEKTDITYTRVQAYRYVVAAALLGFIYSAFQLPFAIYHVVTKKRMIRNGCLPVFDECADQIVAYILATAVGAGFAVTFEYKKILKDFIESFFGEGFDDVNSAGEKFLDRGNIATGVLFLAFVCVAVQAVISSMSRTNTTTSNGIFGRRT